MRLIEDFAYWVPCPKKLDGDILNWSRNWKHNVKLRNKHSMQRKKPRELHTTRLPHPPISHLLLDFLILWVTKVVELPHAVFIALQLIDLSPSDCYPAVRKCSGIEKEIRRLMKNLRRLCGTIRFG